MAVVHVGDAFSTQVQCVVLIARRKLFPRCARTLLNIHRGVHHKVGAIVQVMANCYRNTVGQRPRAHVHCEQVPVRQRRYPLLLPQRAPPAPATPMFAGAPAHRFTNSHKNGRPSKEETQDEFADLLSWKGNITYCCLVMAPFRRSYAAVSRFCRHATTRSRIVTWPLSVLATCSPPGSSASRFLPARMLLPRCARTLLNIHRWVHRKVGATVQAIANCDKNMAENTASSGHVLRAALHKAGIVLYNMFFRE